MSLLEQSPGGGDVSVLRAGPVLVGERLEQRCGALAAGAPLAAEDRSLGQRSPRSDQPAPGGRVGASSRATVDRALVMTGSPGAAAQGPGSAPGLGGGCSRRGCPPSTQSRPAVTGRRAVAWGSAWPLTGCGQRLHGPGQLWQRRPVLLPLLAAGDLGVAVWLLWHARRHHGWDRPGVPVTGVLLLMCALFLGWLAVQHPVAPAVPPSRPSAPVLI